YALLYYCLARMRREKWSLPVTIAFAGLYACWHLRELALYRDELLAADALGLIALVLGLREHARVPLVAPLIPLVWSCGYAGLLIYTFGPSAAPSTYNFLGLIAVALMLFAAFAYFLKTQRKLSVLPSLVFFFTAFVLLTNNH